MAHKIAVETVPMLSAGPVVEAAPTETADFRLPNLGVRRSRDASAKPDTASSREPTTVQFPTWSRKLITTYAWSSDGFRFNNTLDISRICPTHRLTN